MARPAFVNSCVGKSGLVSMGHWIEADGVKFPGVIENYHDGKKLAEITVEQIKVNRGLQAADLADLDPLMCR